MMSHFLCPLLVLVFLTGGSVLLVKASDHAINCGYDNFCQATQKLMSVVNDVKHHLDELSDKQATDLAELKMNLNRSLASKDVSEKLDRLSAYVRDTHDNQVKNVEELKVNLMAAISKQFEKQLEVLLSLEERLKAQNACPGVNEKLDKLAADVRDIHSKQLKDVEELKVNLNRTLVSTAAISNQMEKHSADLLRHDERLKSHDVSQTDLHKTVQNIPKPQDCSDIRAKGNSVSGVYRVYPGNNTRSMEMDVYCDFSNAGQSWLVFQRRKDGSVSFDRPWNEYANGFGNLNGEFWLGNEKLSLLIANKKYKLRIELTDFLGEKRYAEYSTFFVRPSTDKYRLTIGGYSGNAGDSFSYHNNMMFSTKDQDNDAYSRHCAQAFSGGWWFNTCLHSNLNGVYLGGSHTQGAKGIYWYHWKGSSYSYKTTEMKITTL